MSQADEEVYSTIFNALRHGVRRRILRMLSKEGMTFSALNEELGISSSHLTYHLDSLGELVSKNDAMYNLSIFGRAAVDMIDNVEDPPEAWGVPQGLNIYKIVAGLLIVALLLVSGLYSNLYCDYSIQSEALQSKELEYQELRSTFDSLTGIPELINLTKGKWTVNIVQQHDLQYHYDGVAHREQIGPSDSFPRTDSIMVFYTPLANVILEVYLTQRNLPEGFYIPLTLQKGNALLNESGIIAYSYEIGNTTYFEWQSPVIWSRNVTGWGGRFDIEIPSRGWYTLSLTGPMTIDTDAYPSVRLMWDDWQWWLDVMSLHIFASCRLIHGGDYIYYSIETKLIHGHSGWVVEY